MSTTESGAPNAPGKKKNPATRKKRKVKQEPLDKIAAIKVMALLFIPLAALITWGLLSS